MDSQNLIRAMAFDYVDQLSNHGEQPIAWSDLVNFRFEGQRVPLVSQQGIFKPAVLDLPISMRSTYRDPGQDRPYQDEVNDNGYLLYKYRGNDPNHHENVRLRRAMEEAVALLYFVGIAKGLYLAQGAVIIEDHPGDLTFGVQLFEIEPSAIGSVNALTLDANARKRYLAMVTRRVGQAAFRHTVLDAYRRRCTLCRLGHRELLDAAHIIPDAEGGASVVTNGLAMCKIHHAAYDADIIGIRPDHVTEVRADVLAESDGPMLEHGLKELQGTTIHVPRSAIKRPARSALEHRYERFRARV